MWEDEANRNGGKWVLRLKKSISSIVWENLILAILGKFFLNKIFIKKFNFNFLINFKVNNFYYMKRFVEL